MNTHFLRLTLIMKDKELLEDKTAKSLHICKQNENPNKHLIFFCFECCERTNSYPF